MAKIFRPPIEIGDGPSMSIGTTKGSINAYWEACEKYLEKLQNWCRENGSGKYAGEVVRFPVADGKAQYVVYSLRPVQLIHVPTGDAWHYDGARILTASEIKKRVEACDCSHG